MKYEKRADPFYTGGAWRALRNQVLLMHPYCEKCLKKVELGLIVRPNEATMVHHVKPRSLYPELQYEISNLEALCSACHNEEHPERGFKPKPRQAGPRRCVTITNEQEHDHG